MRKPAFFALAVSLALLGAALTVPARAGVIVGVAVPGVVVAPPLPAAPVVVGVYPRVRYCCGYYPYGYYPRFYGPGYPGYVRFGYGWGYGRPRGYYYPGRPWR